MSAEDPVEFRLPPVLASKVDVELRIPLTPFNDIGLEEVLEALGL